MPGVTPTWSLLVHPQEFEERSKTGASDEGLPLDSDYMDWGLRIFGVLTAGRSSTPLWNCDYQTFCRAFRHATNKLGPSIDRARLARPLAEVKKRGRWKSDRSVMRYEKAARLAFTSQSYSAEQRRVFAVCDARLAGTLLGASRAAKVAPRIQR